MVKILLAEDDKQLAGTISKSLSQDGRIVEVAHNGKDAWELLQLSQYDLLILDWEMPEMTGIEVLRSFRAKKMTTPVLMLTGKSDVSDIESGLDQGADDYLTKPFDLKILSARVRALLRRPQNIARTLLKSGDLTLDKDAGKVTKDGQEIELMPKEFALLEFFMRNPNTIFSLEALQTRLWKSESEASTDSVRVQVCNLRRKVEKKGETPLFKVVHRKGYMFDGIVEE
jgi:DNA-binding response OmpR family regulator